MNEFNIGDEIVFSSKCFIGDVIRINKIFENMVVIDDGEHQNKWGFELFRKATPEEIKLGHRIDGNKP